MEIIEALYFMLPAYAANMAPVIFNRIPIGGEPLDLDATLEGKRILGDHKTFRGLLMGIFCAILIVILQQQLTPSGSSLILFNYASLTQLQTVLLGVAFGAGALGGDLIKSFFKRRLGISPGKPWIPFDQLDFVIGALIAVSPFFVPSLLHIMIILILTPLLHVLSNIAAHAVGIKKVWW